MTHFQDAEYVKIANEAWTEAVAIAELADGWKEEKVEKTTVCVCVCVRRVSVRK